MKITIVYRYFWPDTPPYALMLREMTRWFVEAGHDVEILTAQPSYKPGAGIEKQVWNETRDGVHITRIPLLPERGPGIAKLINSALFPLFAFFKLLFSAKRDLYWTATMPPVVQAGLIGLLARIRGGQFLYHMQDIYPEIATVHGSVSKLFPSRLLLMLDKYTQKHADRIVVLSEDMASSIKARGIAPSKLSVVYNFSLGENGDPEIDVSAIDEPRFIFAGNLGRFQNLDFLLDIFAILQDENYILELVGDGRARPHLMKRVSDEGLHNIRFHDHMSADDVFEFLQKSTVGIVSLSPEIYRYAFPSKVLTYMAADLPILGLVETESALSEMLHQSKSGATISWDESVEQAAETVKKLARDIHDGDVIGSGVLNIHSHEFARSNWTQVLGDLDAAKNSKIVS